MFSSYRRVLAAAVAALAVGTAGRAQCDLSGLPGDALAELQGSVRAVTQWDPDGVAGPLPVHLVAGGSFDVGTAHAERVVLWNGTDWTPTGANFSVVSALVVWNNRLIAASEELVFQYDGTAWTLLGGVEYGSPSAPLPGTVNTLAVYNGDLIVGGRFTRVSAPFVPAANANTVAGWNGTTWYGLGAGPASPAGTPVALAATVFTGSLWVGGSFPNGSQRATHLQVWNGTAWSPVAEWDGPIDTLAVRIGTALTNSFLFAGGRFLNLWQSPSSTTALATPTVARYSPSTATWSAIGAPGTVNPTTGCQQLSVRATGLSSYELAGTFTTSGFDRAWRLSGVSWVSLPTIADDAGPITAARLAYFGGRYVIGVDCSPVAKRGLRYHDTVSAEWRALVGHGFTAGVRCVCEDGGELVVGGVFQAIDGAPRQFIARGHAGAWQAMGSGFGLPVHSLARLANGDIVAGGDFQTLGDGTPMARIARWDGSAWLAIGGGMNGSVLALLPLPNGELIAGGAFTIAGGQSIARIARWNGSTWLPLGSGMGGTVRALQRLANGDIVAAGSFTTAGGVAANRVAVWNGSTWAPLDTGLDGTVYALTVGAEGLVAGGSFQQSGIWAVPHVARWNGSVWVPFGPVPVQPNQEIRALATLPGGETVVGGVEFTIGGQTSCASIWRGSAWESLDVRGTSVDVLATGAYGRLLVGGVFARVGPTISANLAQVVSSCPAQAVSVAPGCASNTLGAVTLPWANGLFRTQATGLPANAIVLVVTSVTPIAPGLPLSLLFPEALPGCNLGVAPDILGLAVAAGGTAEAELFLPDSPPLAGVVFYQQMVPLELDGVGAVVAMTATNTLELTGGAF